jgi:hypothetical protein
VTNRDIDRLHALNAQSDINSYASRVKCDKSEYDGYKHEEIAVIDKKDKHHKEILHYIDTGTSVANLAVCFIEGAYKTPVTVFVTAATKHKDWIARRISEKVEADLKINTDTEIPEEKKIFISDIKDHGISTLLTDMNVPRSVAVECENVFTDGLSKTTVLSLASYAISMLFRSKPENRDNSSYEF